MKRSARLAACIGILVLGCVSSRTGARVSGSEAGGVTGTGGAPAPGGASGGAAQESPPRVVAACDKLGAVGAWENVTPREVDLSTFGVTTVSIIPSNTATVYIGTLSGLFKTTDCGATWKHIDTGTLSADIDKGSVAPLIDPVQPEVMYTGSLYGTNGLFKSTDGGVNWKSILTPEVQKIAPYGGFVGGLDIDPRNHLHILVTWHEVCAAPYNEACYAETFDGGTTWTLRNGQKGWIGGEGTQLGFLDENRWYFNSVSNGMWLSSDRGAKWTKVQGISVSHGRGQLYRVTPAGPFFMGAGNGVLFSADGTTWQVMPNSGELIAGVTGDGTTVWSSSAFPYGEGQHPPPDKHYLKARIASPTAWSKFDAPALSGGGNQLAYDPDHHILYSANFWDGVWRVVVE